MMFFFLNIFENVNLFLNYISDEKIILISHGNKKKSECKKVKSH